MEIEKILMEYESREDEETWELVKRIPFVHGKFSFISSKILWYIICEGDLDVHTYRYGLKTIGSEKTSGGKRNVYVFRISDDLDPEVLAKQLYAQKILDVSYSQNPTYFLEWAEGRREIRKQIQGFRLWNQNMRIMFKDIINDEELLGNIFDVNVQVHLWTSIDVTREMVRDACSKCVHRLGTFLDCQLLFPHLNRWKTTRDIKEYVNVFGPKFCNLHYNKNNTH